MWYPNQLGIFNILSKQMVNAERTLWVEKTACSIVGRLEALWWVLGTANT